MILALSGKKGVGKTSAANYLVRFHKFQKISFSKGLKYFSKELFPEFTEDMLDGDQKEIPQKFLDNQTPRDFMEKFGQFLRYWDKDYWVRPVSAIIKINPQRNIVCDDCRFENEVEFFKMVGAYIVRINRYPSQNPYKEDLNSPSENSLNNYNFDYIINECDNTSLTELYNSTLKMLEIVKSK